MKKTITLGALAALAGCCTFCEPEQEPNTLSEKEKAEGWQEIEFPEPVRAKYLRFELVENWGDETTPPWTETSEIKIYP